MGKAMVEIWDRANGTKLSDTWTVDADLYQRNFDDLKPTGKKMNEIGSGGLVLQADHPAVVSGAAVPGRCARLYSDTSLVHTFTLREADRTRIARRHRDRTVVLDGEGLLQRWADAVVRPWISGRPISLDRVWNWASPPLNLSGWSSTTYLHDRSWLPETPEWPEAWPVAGSFAGWIFSRADDTDQPVGMSIFRRSFTLASPQTVVFYVSADNTFELWADGTLVEREPNKRPDKAGFEQTWRYVVEFSAGTHHVGVGVTNWPGQSGTNPAAFLFAAFEVDDWELGDVLFTSATSMGWVCRDYPDPTPGFTAPQILQMLLSEAQARGALAGWSISVHGSHDQLEEFVCRVGTDYLEVIDKLSAWIDVDCADEGLVLHVWPKGEGPSSGVVVDESDITALSDQTDDRFWNAVQGLWAESERWRTNAASITASTRREKSIMLGGVEQRGAVDSILDAWLDANSTPVRSVAASVLDIDAVAGHDWKVRQTAVVLGETLQCVGLSWTVDRTGELIPHPEFDTVSSLRREARLRAVERMIAQHEAPASAAILNPQTRIPSGRPSTMEISWSWSDDIEEALNEIDPDKPWQIKRVERSQRLYEFSVEIDLADLPDAFDDTTIELLKNGSVVNGLYNLVLDTTTARATVRIFGYETVTPADRLQVRCVAEGGHVDGAINLRLADPV